MKLKITMLLILFISMATMAYSSADMDSDKAQLWEALKGFLVLAFLTPFGWGALLIIIYLFFKLGFKATKAVVTADYSEMPSEEKEITMKRELRQAYIDSKNSGC